MKTYSIEWRDAAGDTLRVSVFTALDLRDALRLSQHYLERVEYSEHMNAAQCVLHLEGEL